MRGRYHDEVRRQRAVTPMLSSIMIMAMVVSLIGILMIPTFSRLDQMQSTVVFENVVGQYHEFADAVEKTSRGLPGDSRTIDMSFQDADLQVRQDLSRWVVSTMKINTTEYQYKDFNDTGFTVEVPKSAMAPTQIIYESGDALTNYLQYTYTFFWQGRDSTVPGEIYLVGWEDGTSWNISDNRSNSAEGEVEANQTQEFEMFTHLPSQIWINSSGPVSVLAMGESLALDAFTLVRDHRGSTTGTRFMVPGITSGALQVWAHEDNTHYWIERVNASTDLSFAEGYLNISTIAEGTAVHAASVDKAVYIVNSDRPISVAFGESGHLSSAEESFVAYPATSGSYLGTDFVIRTGERMRVFNPGNTTISFTVTGDGFSFPLSNVGSLQSVNVSFAGLEDRAARIRFTNGPGTIDGTYAPGDGEVRDDTDFLPDLAGGQHGTAFMAPLRNDPNMRLALIPTTTDVSIPELNMTNLPQGQVTLFEGDADSDRLFNSTGPLQVQLFDNGTNAYDFLMSVPLLQSPTGLPVPTTPTAVTFLNTDYRIDVGHDLGRVSHFEFRNSSTGEIISDLWIFRLDSFSYAQNVGGDEREMHIFNGGLVTNFPSGPRLETMPMTQLSANGVLMEMIQMESTGLDLASGGLIRTRVSHLDHIVVDSGPVWAMRFQVTGSFIDVLAEFESLYEDAMGIGLLSSEDFLESNRNIDNVTDYSGWATDLVDSGVFYHTPAETFSFQLTLGRVNVEMEPK